MYDWLRTDTAAIMFTALQTKKSARICAVTAYLRDMTVDPALLREAVYSLLPRFPVFCRRLRKGLFWGYLEAVQAPPLVLPDTELPGSMRWISRTDGGPEFRVLYGKEYITVEIAHVLADGTGYMELLKAIVLRYLELSGVEITDAGGIRRFDEAPTQSESENAFSRFCTKEKLGMELLEKAYQYPHSYTKDYLCNAFALLDVAALKAVAKPRNMTITEFLVAVMILATLQNEKTPIRDTIVISVPVNMRKFFPTDTLRNFSGNVPVCFAPGENHARTLDEICECVRPQLKPKLNRETMQSFINSTFSATQNPVLRIIPGFVKWPGLRLIQKKQHEKNMTVLFSNVGDISFPACIRDKIARVEMVGGDARNYGLTKFCTAASVNGRMSICFSMANRDSSLFERFVSILRENGVPVETDIRDGSTATALAYHRPGIGKLSLAKLRAFCHV